MRPVDVILAVAVNMAIVMGHRHTNAHSKPKMIRPIAVCMILALSGVSEAQPLFDPPSGLSAIAAPDISGTPLKKVEKFSDESGLIQVTVLVHPPVTHRKNAAEFMDGALAGMKNKGFIDSKVSDTEVRGYYCKKIDGMFRSESHEGTFRVASLMLFSSDALYSISLTVHESAQFEPTIEDLADRLHLAGVPIVLTSGPGETSSAYQAGEKLGQVMAYAVMILAIVLVARRIARKKAEPARGGQGG